jgi:hypothetical protein
MAEDVTAGHFMGMSMDSEPSDPVQIPALDDDARFHDRFSHLWVTIELPSDFTKEIRERVYLVDFAVKMDGKGPMEVGVNGLKFDDPDSLINKPASDEHLLFVMTGEGLFPTFILRRNSGESWTYFSCTVTRIQ